MSTYIDTEQIKRDPKYQFELFKRLLKTVNRKTNSPAQFYYQYNPRNRFKSYYTHLMTEHIIAIKANSLEEANVLNNILRVIIDNHGLSLTSFIYNNLTEEDFFDSIKNDNSLTTYKNYVSNTLKPMESKTMWVYPWWNVMNEVSFEKINVFDYAEVQNLLDNQNLTDKLSDSKNPESFI